jgi:hypothetical protein
LPARLRLAVLKQQIGNKSRCFNFVKNFLTAMRTIAPAKNDCFILFHTVSFLIAFKNHDPAQTTMALPAQQPAPPASMPQSATSTATQPVPPQQP